MRTGLLRALRDTKSARRNPSHGTNVSGERQRPGAVDPWATSGAEGTGCGALAIKQHSTEIARGYPSKAEGTDSATLPLGKFRETSP